MVGKGRNARDEGNEGPRFWMGRIACGRPCAEPANGDETAGRVMVMVMAATGLGRQLQDGEERGRAYSLLHLEAV